MIGIPSEYLAKMGGYSTKIEGVEIKVKVVDIGCESLIETHINQMRSALKTQPVKVVGVDFKRLTHHTGIILSERLSLVLCDGANCLIIHLPSEMCSSSNDHKHLRAPEKLMEFLQDPSVCFVGSTRRPSVLAPASSWGVEAGALAALVLKKPSLNGSKLWVVSRVVGIRYEGSSTSGTGDAVKVDSVDPVVLTDEQVNLAVTEAYTNYKIGHKLLTLL